MEGSDVFLNTVSFQLGTILPTMLEGFYPSFM